MDTKTALLDCAEEAVRARGYDGFSYADLAQAVGIRKASVHHHFPAKSDLALALIDRYTRRFFLTLAHICETNETAGERLGAYIAACLSVIDGGQKLCLSVALCVGRDSLSEAVLLKLDDFHVSVTAWLVDVFATGKSDGSILLVGDPSIEGPACLAQVEGAQIIARAAKDALRFHQATASLLTRIQA